MPQHEKVGSEIFLQGKYLNLGINSSGTLGTRATAPGGIITDAANGYIRLGMIGDVDGFGVGAAGTRDAMLWGTPIESFTIGYDKAGVHYNKTNSERAGVTQITGGVTTDLSHAGVESAGWAGTTSEGLAVKQVFALADDAKYVRVDVTLTNTTAGGLDGLRYMRSMDPDQGSTFETINKIIEQGHDGADGALIAAYTTTGKTPVFYYTQDDRAIVSTFGFDNRNPYAASAFDAPQAEGYSAKADQAININFSIGHLNAGASTTVTYYLGITDDLAATVKAINANSPGVPVIVAPPPPAPPPPPPPPVNHVPIALADGAKAVAGETITGHVLANDSDPDGDALTASLVTGPAHGTVTLGSNGDYSYTAAPGYSGSDSFVYAASDGKAVSNATVSIDVIAPPPPPPPANIAPTAVSDKASTIGTALVSGNVLTNDSDGNGDALAATVKTGPAHGTLTLSSSGAFTYVAEAGFSGTDSFTYAASDGKAETNATVTIAVDKPVVVAPPPVVIPPSPPPVVDIIDGSSSASEVLSGTTNSDTFYFDNLHFTGADKVQDFDRSDILLTSVKVKDSNNDGWITFSGNKLNIDVVAAGSAVTLEGVSKLRYMGVDGDGHFAYADGLVRPKGAIESKLGDNAMSGDSGDKKAQTFFFDTALGLDLGHDRLSNFGKKDILVTTKSLELDSSGHVGLGAGVALDLGTVDGVHSGDIAITELKGAAVNALEFDGSVMNNGTEYFVYSLNDSTAGVHSLHF